MVPKERPTMTRFQNQFQSPPSQEIPPTRSDDMLTGVDETGRYRNPQPDWIRRGVLLILALVMAFVIATAFWWFATGGLTPEA